MRLRDLLQASIEEAHPSVEWRLAGGDELITDEGESAVMTSARFRPPDSGELECTVAIAGDDPFLCVDAIGSVGRHHGAVLALIRRLGLGLGAARRRWFRYDPPARWLGLRRGAATIWLHPRDPRVPARITIFDARPFRESQAELLDRFLFVRMSDDLVPDVEQAPEDVASDHGLHGRSLTLSGQDARGERVVRIAVAMADDQFAYLAHFEGDAGETAAFRQVIRSFKPVAPRPVAAEVAVIWSD